VKRPKDAIPASSLIQAQPARSTGKAANALAGMLAHSLTVYLNAIYTLVDIVPNFALTAWAAVEEFASLPTKNPN